MEVRNYRRIDTHYVDTKPWLYRVFLRVFRKWVNIYAKDVLLVHKERGTLDSKELHTMCHTVDCNLWPERFQSPRTAGDDAAFSGGA